MYESLEKYSLYLIKSISDISLIFVVINSTQLTNSLKNKNVIGNDLDKIVIVNAFIDSNFRYKNSFFIIYPEML